MSKTITTTPEIVNYCGELLAAKVLSLHRKGELVDRDMQSIVKSLSEQFTYDVERFSNAKQINR